MMKRIYGADLKKIQLEILDVVADFCDKNDISYWIDCGTLLGAIRHKGYIPWDDDIDIGMLRPDFDRFMATFNASNERYKFYCIENDKNFFFPHGKVLDTTTLLYEPDINGTKLAINVDIFVYDNAPDDDAALEKMYDKRDWYRRLHNQRNLGIPPHGNAFRRAIVYCMRAPMKLLPAGHYVKLMVKNSKRLVKADTKRVGNFTSFARMSCDKRVFDDFTTTEFEGKMYRIPIGYDEWLRSFYGDYMQLPPEEKRVSHHKFEAYIEDMEG